GMADILGLKKEEEAFEKYREFTREKLLIKLRELYVKLGRVPMQEDITDDKDMPGIVTYHRMFGSYSRACELIGLQANASIFGRVYGTYDQDGNVCLSKSEKLIGDILIENNIKFEKEILYKNIIPDYDSKNIRCDWLIDNKVVVEFFGMMDRDDYKIRANAKIRLCEKNNIKLVKLYPEDIRYNFLGLINKFKEAGFELKV
ncbi:homing endonuclease associated repeat-containing protein, partial [Streptomyces sp. NPDC057927]